MVIEFQESQISSIKCDAEVIFIVAKNVEHKWIKKDSQKLVNLGCKYENHETVFLNESNKVVAAIDSISSENLRIAAALAIKAIKGEFKSLKVGLYLEGKQKRECIEAMVEGFLLGDYVYESYKSKKREHKIESIVISNSEYSNKKIEKSEVEEAIKRATIKCEAINSVRDIINTPPEDATPERLADIAEESAKECGISCKIYDEKHIKSNGMGAFYAVGKGSDNPPRLIHLSYKPQNPKAKVALVGKGLTYDTGGLSLKPSDYMTTMKADKSGGVTVLGIIIAASRLQIPVEIEAIIGAAENMVSGRSYRPDDVLTAKNGKTIEVKNTDAEGRLVLADCLCFAQEFEPDYIVDLATLTGACVVALGEYTFGVMGFNEELKSSICDASNKEAELSATLPFNKHLKKLLKSEIADVSNISSSRYGGAITAALFLSEFIEEKNRDKWVHLDIAGPAFVEKSWDYNPFGASGVALRTVLRWLESLGGK